MKYKVPTKEQVLHIVKSKGHFNVHRYNYRNDKLRRVLKKWAKSDNSPIKFDGIYGCSLHYVKNHNYIT